MQEFLTTTRNEIVSSKLHDNYDGFVAENIPEIHCVSKTMYWNNRNNDRVAYERYESFLNLSGIKLLRRYCISIISATQHQAASRYMRHDIPALVAKVELWVQSGAGTLNAESKQNIARVCNTLEESLHSVSTLSTLFYISGLPNMFYLQALLGGSSRRVSRTLQKNFDDNICLCESRFYSVLFSAFGGYRLPKDTLTCPRISTALTGLDGRSRNHV